jgi:hypothetical protein
MEPLFRKIFHFFLNNSKKNGEVSSKKTRGEGKKFPG